MSANLDLSPIEYDALDFPGFVNQSANPALVVDTSVAYEFAQLVRNHSDAVFGIKERTIEVVLRG